MNGVSALREETSESALTSSVTGGHRDKSESATWRKLSPEPNYARALIPN